MREMNPQKVDGLSAQRRLESTGTAPKFSKELRTAIRKLIMQFGAPRDLLGEPPLRPQARTQMLAMVSGLNLDDRKKLAAMAEAKQLSEKKRRILPKNFERALLQILQQIGLSTPNEPKPS